MGELAFPAGDPRANNMGYWSQLAAKEGPERIAMIDLSRSPDRVVTYREFEERLDRFAALATASS